MLNNGEKPTMRVAIFASVCLLLVALPGSAQDQIYKTRDSQGNTVYSDVPTSDSEQMKLPATNTADSVEVRPPEPPEQKLPEQSPNARETAPDGPAVVGDDDDYYWYDQPEQPGKRKLMERGGEGVGKPKPTPLPDPVRPRAGRR